MKFFLTAFATLLLGASFTASAAVTGKELLNRCTAAEKSVDSKDELTSEEALDGMWCMGYMSGLLDGFSVNDYTVGGAKVMCVPEEGLTRTQALRIVNKWFRENPDALSKNGRRGALLALASAYPCK
ncbi:MAG: hypothetical protein LBE24_02565 [Methylobacillus sp.]|jgi:hypothetical protein|nr:hypothetical protein [Methylobacillus sp.]